MPYNHFNDCGYDAIEVDGVIYTENKITGETAEEVYERFLANKDKQIDICPEKTTEEKLEGLIGQVSELDEIIANLSLEVL